jgi:hypothetical protein
MTGMAQNSGDTTEVSSAVPYKYILSLPERVIRSLGALSGGLLKEIGSVALPPGIRQTTLYRTMVEVTLRFLIEEVGQVEGVYPYSDRLAQNFLLQRTASHGIELLGILAFRASPVWVLAALADITGGGHRLIHEISQALKNEGLLDPNARFERMDQLLDGLEKTSDHLAQTLNLPPVDVPGLRREWEKLKEELQRIPPKNLPAPERLDRIWTELQQTAITQNRSVFTISSLIAVSTIAHVPANLLWLSRAAHSAARRTGTVVGTALLDHYSQTLGEITRTGFLEYWTREFRPYLRAAAEQFAPGRESLTERLLHRRPY